MVCLRRRGGHAGYITSHSPTRSIFLISTPGQTAYVGWKEYADPQKNDVVFVTTGAGKKGYTTLCRAGFDIYSD